MSGLFHPVLTGPGGCGGGVLFGSLDGVCCALAVVALRDACIGALLERRTARRRQFHSESATLHIERAGKNKYLCMCIHIIICVYNISKVIFFMLNVSDAFFFRALACQKGSHFDCSRCGALDCVASAVATTTGVPIPSEEKRHIRREQRRATKACGQTVWNTRRQRPRV